MIVVFPYPHKPSRRSSVSLTLRADDGFNISNKLVMFDEMDHFPNILGDIAVLLQKRNMLADKLVGFAAAFAGFEGLEKVDALGGAKEFDSDDAMDVFDDRS